MNEAIGPSYEIKNNDTEVGIKCLYCGLTSYNPEDVRQHYCGNCHLFHDDAAAIKESLVKKSHGGTL